MIKGGLTSVSFGSMSPKEIVSIVVKSGLKAIEWGGNRHVPHGNLKKAKEVKNLTRDAGLIISSYGSYYTAGESEKDGLFFEKVLSSALELEVQNIRIWAGAKGSNLVDELYWETVVSDVRMIADIAAKEMISISFEFHNETLTDTNESCYKLINKVNKNNVFTYWQPNLEYSYEERKLGLKILANKITNFHVFKCEYEKDKIRVFPLEKAIDEWRSYFEFMRDSPQKHYALIEVFNSYTPEKFFNDAKILRSIIKE